MGLGSSPSVLLVIQFSADAPGKVAKDDPSACDPITMWETLSLYCLLYLLRKKCVISQRDC